MAITFRPGEVADGPAVHDVFVQATADLNQRVGLPETDNFWGDPAFVASYWQRRQSLFDHLARTADQVWVAGQDGQIGGFARSSMRDVDHQFLLQDRQALLFRRGGEVVGCGYFGKGTGPIALLDTADFPAVLAWAESDAAARGDDEFGMQLPLVNRHAVDYLLGRGFQLEDFTVFFMSDEPFGRFENYVISSPPFFM